MVKKHRQQAERNPAVIHEQYPDGSPVPSDDALNAGIDERLPSEREAQALAAAANGAGGERGIPLGNGPAETLAQKFRRLAEQRVNRAVYDLERLIPLANKRAYSWTPEQAAEILAALKDSVDKVRRAFEGQHEKNVAFRLSV